MLLPEAGQQLLLIFLQLTTLHKTTMGPIPGTFVENTPNHFFLGIISSLI
jgi:hypothetical protein